MVNKRAKSLKSMTVSELVKERKKHSDRINKIDEILTEATKALGQRVVEDPFIRQGNLQTSLGATPIMNNNNNNNNNNRMKFSETAPLSLEPPNIQPLGHGTKSDIEPVFTLFDAEADARLKSQAEEPYKENTSLDYIDSSINTEELQSETDSLRDQLSKELKDIPVPTSIPEESKDS